ncbi:CD226 antigen isoform X2 [Sander vitreus]
MEAVQKDHWYFVVLIFLPFLKVAVQQMEAATVRLEEGMVLNCLCPWDGNLSMVSWTKVPDKDPVAIFHPEYGVVFSHHYRERIEFLRTTPMDGSISMRNVTHQDIGVYHCSVQTFPQGPWTRNIQVEDLDEPPEEDNSAESPTPEVIETDNNLTISCNHEHNGTIYQVILEKMPHGQPWGIIGVCKKVEGGLVGEDYSDRGRVSCADSLDVSLHLTGVVQEDGGFYRCTFSTDAGVRTTTVLLTVPPPDERGTFRHLEIAPKDGPHLWRSTILFLMSWLISLDFPMMSKKEALCLRWIQPICVHDVYLHRGWSCWAYSTYCHHHTSSEAQEEEQERGVQSQTAPISKTAKLLCVSQDGKGVRADKKLPGLCEPTDCTITQNQTSA